MANRVYFASQGLSIGGNTVQGAQSVGISINYTTEQAFQLGQLAIYDNIITDAEVTVTASKNFDGYTMMYAMVGGTGGLSAASRSTNDIVIASATASEADSLADGGQTVTSISGAELSSISYNFPSDGWSTEEISFVADNKSTGGSVTPPVVTAKANAYRHHIGGSFIGADNITISCDLARESIFKLGQFKPTTRYANFPIEVTIEVTYTASSVDTTAFDLDDVDCTQGLGSSATYNVTVCDVNDNSSTAAYTITVGGAQLSSMNYEGGDTGGGNATVTYTYTAYNSLSITENL
jgi:hypothetical protein